MCDNGRWSLGLRCEKKKGYDRWKTIRSVEKGDADWALEQSLFLSRSLRYCQVGVQGRCYLKEYKSFDSREACERFRLTRPRNSVIETAAQ